MREFGATIDPREWLVMEGGCWNGQKKFFFTNRIARNGMYVPKRVWGGVQYAPYQEGSWVEKPWHVCCCYSHDVSGEQALQREVVMETKPSRVGLVEYFVKNIRIG